MKRVLRGARIHLLDHSIFVSAAFMAFPHGVYTVILVNAADQCSKPITLSLKCFYFPMYILKLREYEHLAQVIEEKKENSTRWDSDHRPNTLLGDSEANSLPLRYFGTCYEMEQNINKLCSDT